MMVHVPLPKKQNICSNCGPVTGHITYARLCLPCSLEVRLAKIREAK